MKILKGFLMVMGVLAVLAIIALIIGYILAFLTPDIRASMRPVVLSSEAVDSLQQKIESLKKDAANAETTKTSKNIDLVITEEEINSALVMMLAEGTLPAREILVNLNNDYLITYTTWSTPGLPLKTGAIGQIDIENGKPKIVIQDFFLGKLPLPDSVDRAVQDYANIIITLNIPFEELRLDLKKVTIGDGQVTISGSTKTAK